MMPPDTTVATAYDWIRTRGFVRNRELDETVAALADYPLTEAFGDMPAAIVELLCYAGSGVEIVSEPHPDMSQAYRDTFVELTECTSRALTITDVDVDDAGGLTFVVDGRAVIWDVFDGFEEGFLDRMTFLERMDDLTPAGTGRWAHVMGENIPINTYLFGEPEHLRELSEWGVEDLAIYATG